MACAPTEVSPDSITASVPSSTALATSEASARVGRELVIIDSSIWVATMTGLPRSRATWMARFCTSGTFSSGSSTPRSPRATMIPSNASTISSSRSTASGFSSLAITGTSMSSCRMISRTSSASRAERTKLRAMKSTDRCRANRRSASSFAERAGTLTATPGRESPLLFDTSPPSTTRQVTSGPSTPTTVSAILPSSTSSRSPSLASLARSL